MASALFFVPCPVNWSTNSNRAPCKWDRRLENGALLGPLESCTSDLDEYPHLGIQAKSRALDVFYGQSSYPTLKSSSDWRRICLGAVSEPVELAHWARTDIRQEFAQ